MKLSSQFLTDPSSRPATAVVNLIGKQAEIYMSVIGTNAMSHKNYCQHFGHWMSNGAGKFSPFPKMSFYLYRKQYALLRSTGVRVGGGAECMVPPTPSLGGLCPPDPWLRRLCESSLRSVCCDFSIFSAVIPRSPALCFTWYGIPPKYLVKGKCFEPGILEYVIFPVTIATFGHLSSRLSKFRFREMQMSTFGVDSVCPILYSTVPPPPVTYRLE